MYMACKKLALLTLLAGLLAGCSERAAQLQPGDPAPAVVVQTLAGEQLNLPSDFNGKVVAVRFWADWCPFCEGEMKAIEPVYQQFRDQGLVVVAINVGQSRRVAQRFADKLGVTFIIGLDEESTSASRYGVLGLPTTFFVDRQGKVRNKIIGESEAVTFTRMVKALL
jgi:peroxiredoxin